MTTSKIIIVLGLAISLFGCGHANNEMKEEQELLLSKPNPSISSSAAVEDNKDTTRKFIRTAELKFKVKSVIKSTYDIEEITNRHGGFVTLTSLISDIDNVTTTAVSADSSLETTYYKVTNSITLRIPNTKLDTTLKEISRNIDFLDYRTIKAQDVALQILSNNLTQKRASQNEERLTNASPSLLKGFLCHGAVLQFFWDLVEKKCLTGNFIHDNAIYCAKMGSKVINSLI